MKKPTNIAASVRARLLNGLENLASHDTIVKMRPLEARVRNGRLVLDARTDLPDGTEVA